MKNGLRISIILASAVVLIFGIGLWSGYNSLVDADVAIDETYSLIDGRLQQRFDTINSFVATIEGLQENAQTIYQMITTARTQYLNAKASGDIEGLIEADAASVQAMNQLFVLMEQYPDDFSPLSGYQALLDNIASLESQLFVARRDYNEAVADYNASVRRFPKVMYASLLGFETVKPFWRLSESAGEVPVIDFGE
ncbi:MAG: LemA family protein [Bacillus subtilis]|nr:LemA family protein [Bacillus subtilis]